MLFPPSQRPQAAQSTPNDEVAGNCPGGLTRSSTRLEVGAGAPAPFREVPPMNQEMRSVDQLTAADVERFPIWEFTNNASQRLPASCAAQQYRCEKSTSHGAVSDLTDMGPDQMDCPRQIL